MGTRLGGSAGNSRLTALTAIVLLVLLAIEGCHAALAADVPVVAHRRRHAARTDRGAEARDGRVPLHSLLHAPSRVRRGRATEHACSACSGRSSSWLRSGSSRRGVALAALGPGAPTVLLPLHKASFAVWVGGDVGPRSRTRARATRRSPRATCGATHSAGSPGCGSACSRAWWSLERCFGDRDPPARSPRGCTERRCDAHPRLTGSRAQCRTCACWSKRRGSSRQLLGRGLREEGHAADVAGRRRGGALDGARGAYDAIVLDVMLPGADGFEVCRRFRDDGRLDAGTDADRARRGRRPDRAASTPAPTTT